MKALVIDGSTALGFLMAERRKRATQADVTEALHVVLSLPIEIDRDTARRVPGETAGLARQYELTIYDAAYLELAMRLGATPATSDTALARAAKKAGVRLAVERLSNISLRDCAVLDSPVVVSGR
jgi:predicted nucleic acid-binding protein